MSKSENPGRLYHSVFGNIPIAKAWDQMGFWPKLEMRDALEKYQFDSGFLTSQECRFAIAFVVGALKAWPSLFANTHFAMSVLGLPEYELQEAGSHGDAASLNSLSSFSKRELSYLLDDLVSLDHINSSEVAFCRPELKSFVDILRTHLKK